MKARKMCDHHMFDLIQKLWMIRKRSKLITLHKLKPKHMERLEMCGITVRFDHRKTFENIFLTS